MGLHRRRGGGVGRPVLPGPPAADHGRGSGPPLRIPLDHLVVVPGLARAPDRPGGGPEPPRNDGSPPRPPRPPAQPPRRSRHPRPATQGPPYPISPLSPH